MLTLPKKWHEVLKEEFKKPYIANLKSFLEEEKQAGMTVFPPEELVFNAFRLTPYEEVKVVIMGQDPYHGPGQAHGLSFSVPRGVPAPPSLQNIFKEIRSDLGFDPPRHGCLEDWAKQGVLMLNAVLTVRQNQANSHKGRGWEHFTDSVIEKLRDRTDPIVFILWGRLAQEKVERILLSKKTPHAILEAAHPSPFSAHSGFFGCRHFSKANAYLKEWRKTQINWRIL